MSKWGKEEKETLEAIENIQFSGNVLNVASGDGRFIISLLREAEKVLAIDNNDLDLEILKNNCPRGLQNKLYIKNVDITKPFPFDNETFEGVFCTGTLHLFHKEIIIQILEEMKRVLKPNGKLLFDFATDIYRTDKNGVKVSFKEEGNYTIEEAMILLEEQFKDWKLKKEVAHFIEENADSSTGYQTIKGKFIIISATKGDV